MANEVVLERIRRQSTRAKSKVGEKYKEIPEVISIVSPAQSIAITITIAANIQETSQLRLASSSKSRMSMRNGSKNGSSSTDAAPCNEATNSEGDGDGDGDGPRHIRADWVTCFARRGASSAPRAIKYSMHYRHHEGITDAIRRPCFMRDFLASTNRE